MRWATFVVLTFLCIALELSLRGVLELRSIGGISPSFVAPLAVFVSMFAPRMTALWSCLLLGLLMDISTPIAPHAGASFYIFGPYALGYVFGGFMILQLRPMVFLQRSLTIGFLTALCLFAVALVTVAIFIIRSWYAPDPSIYPISPSATGEMLRRFGIALYSGIFAILFGWLLLTTLPFWGFPTTTHRRVGRW